MDASFCGIGASSAREFILHAFAIGSSLFTTPTELGLTFPILARLSATGCGQSTAMTQTVPPARREPLHAFPCSCSQEGVIHWIFYLSCAASAGGRDDDVMTPSRTVTSDRKTVTPGRRREDVYSYSADTIEGPRAPAPGPNEKKSKEWEESESSKDQRPRTRTKDSDSESLNGQSPAGPNETVTGGKAHPPKTQVSEDQRPKSLRRVRLT